MQAVARWAGQAGAGVLRLAVVPDNENAPRSTGATASISHGELGDLMPDGVRREHIMVKDLSVEQHVTGWRRAADTTGAHRRAS